MNFADYSIALPIAILYPFFFGKLSDVMTERLKNQKMCDGITYSIACDPKVEKCKKSNLEFIIQGEKELETKDYRKPNPEREICDNKKQALLDYSDTVRFIILIVAGLLAIFAGAYISHMGVKVGLGLAGMLTLLYASWIYWGNMNEHLKLFMIGFALFTLLSTPWTFKYFM